MLKIKTHNQIAVVGLDRLPRDRYEVGTEISDPDGLLLRSHALQVEELACARRTIAGRTRSVWRHAFCSRLANRHERTGHERASGGREKEISRL